MLPMQSLVHSTINFFHHLVVDVVVAWLQGSTVVANVPLQCYTIDCIDYVTGIGHVIQAPGHSVLRANAFSMGSCWAAGH